jgi:hypothetical protein
VACPDCGEKQQVETWPNANVTLYPQVKERLLSQRLSGYVCSLCGRAQPVVYPLTYHDMDRRILIRFTLGDEPVKELNVAVREQLQGYRLRLVRTLHELVEKVLTAEFDLDDRAVELMKADMMGIIRSEVRDREPRMHFVKVFTKPGGARMLQFEVAGLPGVPHGNVLYLDSPWQNYKHAHEHFELNSTTIGARIHWERVDEAYVRDMLARA